MRYTPDDPTCCDCHQPIPPGYVRCRDCIRALHERTAR